MVLSGLVGAGAARGLEEAITQQLMQAQVQEAQRRAVAQEQLASQRLAQDASQHSDMMGFRTRQQDFAEQQADEALRLAGGDQLRDDEERVAQRLAKSQAEQDQREFIETLPPTLRTVAGVRQRLGFTPDADLVMSPEEIAAKRQADDDRDVAKAGRIADAQASAHARYRQPARPEAMTPGQKFNATRALRNDFTRETAAAREVQTQYQLMSSALDAARRGDLAAGSQGVLVTFQKILDPTSVVRESEYARSASGQALLSRIEGAAQQLARGGAGVPVAELERFVRLAETFAQNQAQAAAETKAQIEAIANDFGIDPARVVRDLGPAGSGASQAPGSGPAIGTKGMVNGIPAVWDGQGWVRQ